MADLLSGVSAMGRNAGLVGDPIESCPYHEQDTPRERMLARAWVAAYLAARPPELTAIDYDE